MKNVDTPERELMPFNGRLNAVPIPDIETDISTPQQPESRQMFGLSWEFTTNNMPPELPAGLAILEPPIRSVGNGIRNMRLEFDYRDPSRLLRVEFSMGRVVVDYREIDDPVQQMIAGGMMHPAEQEIAKLALGQETLNSTEISDRFHGWIEKNSELPKLGRIALLQTMLDRKNIPLDGLWALEAATLFHDLGDATTSAHLHPLVQRLLRASEPALRHLDTTALEWLGQAIEPTRELFRRARAAGAINLGLLGEELLREDSNQPQIPRDVDRSSKPRSELEET